MYNLKNAGILVVEDMAPMLALTKSILNILGFQDIYGATSGEEAFEVFQAKKPDLVITDWALGEMNGIDLTNKIRKDPKSVNPYVPIILMTGYSSIPRVEIARDGGITEFLVKPFMAKDLYARIVQVVEKPRQFVESGDFFGPDRRRRKNPGYAGTLKRESDDLTDEEKIMLIDLQDEVSKL